MCSKKYTNMCFCFSIICLSCFCLDHSKSPLDDLNCYLFIVNSHNHLSHFKLARNGRLNFCLSLRLDIDMIIHTMPAAASATVATLGGGQLRKYLVAGRRIDVLQLTLAHCAHVYLLNVLNLLGVGRRYIYICLGTASMLGGSAPGTRGGIHSHGKPTGEASGTSLMAE